MSGHSSEGDATREVAEEATILAPAGPSRAAAVTAHKGSKGWRWWKTNITPLNKVWENMRNVKSEPKHWQPLKWNSNVGVQVHVCAHVLACSCSTWMVAIQWWARQAWYHGLCTICFRVSCFEAMWPNGKRQNSSVTLFKSFHLSGSQVEFSKLQSL